MAPQTTMRICQDLILECQHCYMICRYTDAAVRRNCPACGLAIANWETLTAAQHAREQGKAGAAEQGPDPA